MENIVSGLHTALDAVSDALHIQKTPPSSPTAVLSPLSSPNTSGEYSAEINKSDDDCGHRAKIRRNRRCRNNHHKKSSKALERRQSLKLPPEEQEYAEPVDHNTVDVEPTQEELKDISAAGTRLWKLDLNRLTPGLDYDINCGNGKKVSEKGDMAEDPLFSRVNEDVLERPTFFRFHALLDNYTADQSVTEDPTEEDKQEQRAFIEEISRSAPIMYLHKYLAARGNVSTCPKKFKKQLRSLWFKLYNGGEGHNSSSAFEHVFVGEIESGFEEEEVSGFHNWITFYTEELEGNVDYQGYILPNRRNHREPDAHTQCLMIQFTWNDHLKRKASIFVGVSPEFELALYTLCFYGGQSNNHMELGPYSVNIKCYHLPKDKKKLGSCFPILQKHCHKFTNKGIDVHVGYT